MRKELGPWCRFRRQIAVKECHVPPQMHLLVHMERREWQIEAWYVYQTAIFKGPLVRTGIPFCLRIAWCIMHKVMGKKKNLQLHKSSLAFIRDGGGGGKKGQKSWCDILPSHYFPSTISPRNWKALVWRDVVAKTYKCFVLIHDTTHILQNYS